MTCIYASSKPTGSNTSNVTRTVIHLRSLLKVHQEEVPPPVSKLYDRTRMAVTDLWILNTLHSIAAMRQLEDSAWKLLGLRSARLIQRGTTLLSLQGAAEIRKCESFHFSELYCSKY
jgi:hypothetical protein